MYRESRVNDESGKFSHVYQVQEQDEEGEGDEVDSSNRQANDK